MEKQKKYWFWVLPHIYYVKRDDKALLYNTQSGQYIHFSNHKIMSIIDEACIKKNLGVIVLQESQLQDQEVNYFIQESVEKNICKIEETDTSKTKPIQLMPVLNLQRDVEKLKTEDGRSIGEGVMNYLSDVTIYLNNHCLSRCKWCNLYYKQSFSCFCNGKSEEIDFELLTSFLTQIKKMPIRRIAITGGNIFDYSRYDLLINFLKNNELYPLLGIHYTNFNCKQYPLIEGFPLEIFVTFPINKNLLKTICRTIKNNLQKIVFEITSAEEYQVAEEFIGEMNIQNYAVRPIYTQNNYSFFEDNIFLAKEDIFSGIISQRMIFARQKLNTNYFGNIYLYPNGDVKANPTQKVIGNLFSTTLPNILEKELLENTAWRIIRNIEPCTRCIYQFLCPSPSNYEIVIGKTNLCNIKP